MSRGRSSIPVVVVALSGRLVVVLVGFAEKEPCCRILVTEASNVWVCMKGLEGHDADWLKGFLACPNKQNRNAVCWQHTARSKVPSFSMR